MHRGNLVATVRKTITLTDAQDDWIKAQVANGDFTNDSEYFRDLIRRDQEKERALKAAIDEGLASGISPRTVDDIWAEAEARYKASE
jgi:antitoxin ParD1/3/4